MSRKPLKGVLRGESRLVGKLASSRVLGPDGLYFDGRFSGVATGIYRDNIKQTHQFQDVLEELRLQHQPEHWASWALDGSLEEDRGQFPLGMDGGWQWVDVGPRKAVRFDGSNNAGLYYGTDEDFQWVHEERVFTISTWYFPREGFPGVHLLGTNNASAGNTTGFSLWIDNNGRSTIYVPNAVGLTQFTPSASIRGAQPALHTWVANNVNWKFYLNGNFVIEGAITGAGPPRTGHSYAPFTIGWRSTATIWNAFATNHILTDAEIYRLYVAGMADIMTF